jgi:hypothetical protein
MRLKDLSKSEQEIVLQCMTAIVDGTAIPEWEFHTRLGIVRPTLRRVISRWPERDDRFRHSDGYLAINNCLNQVCHEISVSPSEWDNWFTYPMDRVKLTLARWSEKQPA